MGRKQQGQNAGKPRLLAVGIGIDVPLSTRVRSRGEISGEHFISHVSQASSYLSAPA